MAIWGSGSFDNDDANDWVYELEKAGSGILRETLEAVTEADQAADVPTSACAVAAGEVVAAMRGRGAVGLPDEVTAFVQTAGDAPSDLVALANEAVTRVFEDSGLRDKWDGADDFEDWEDALGDLLDRLEPAGGRRMT